jgi:SNF2 family DNA or RNA helicase
MNVRITSDASGNVCIKPTTFLGGPAFQTYRTAVTGSRFDPVRKLQVTVLTKLPQILERLTKAGFQLDIAPDVRASLGAVMAQTAGDVAATVERAKIKDAELAARGRALYPFQKTGMAWLTSRHGALLSDEMGLGKTVQTLMALPDNAPVLVVCPAVAKGVWKREAGMWRPEYKVTLLSGRGSFRWPAKGEILVTNYDILGVRTDTDEQEVFDSCPKGLVLVGDEIHACKNAKALRTKAWRSLAVATQKAGGRVWGLSGTPLLNRGPELWAVLQSLGLSSEAFGNWDKFVSLMGGYKGRFGYVWPRTPPDPYAVGEAIKPVMLRRLRTEVLPDLPTKTYNTVSVDLNKKTAKVCDTALALIRHAGLDRSGPDEGLTVGEVSEARAALALAKIPTLLEIVEEFEENEEPLVVFSAHRAPIDELASRPGWQTITGDVSPAERSRIEERFQRGELKGVAGTVTAAGVAITLTRAHQVIFVDRDWTPALNEQAEDRVCRIGQDRGVIVTDLVADHALDHRLYEVLGRKKALIETTVEQGRQLSPIHVDRQTTIEQILERSSLGTREVVAMRKTVTQEVVDEVLARADELDAQANGGKLQRFQPRNALEEWARDALCQLSLADSDHAREQNGVGFNKMDNAIGHKLARELVSTRADGGLTDKQWTLAIKLCTKYQGQVGPKPSLSKVTS